MPEGWYNVKRKGRHRRSSKVLTFYLQLYFNLFNIFTVRRKLKEWLNPVDLAIKLQNNGPRNRKNLAFSSF